MLQTIKKLLINAGILSLFLAPVAVVAPVSVSAVDDCSGIADCLDAGSATVDEDAANDGDAEERVNDLITLIVNIFSLIVGIIAVIMIIIGGLKYITSNGDSGNVTSAKNTILYAIIGLVIVVFAQLIVRFVLQKTTESGE